MISLFIFFNVQYKIFVFPLCTFFKCLCLSSFVQIVVTLIYTMFTKAINTLVSIMSFLFVNLAPLCLNILCISLNFQHFVSSCLIIPQMWEGHFNGFNDLLVLNINFIYHHYGFLLTIACIHIVICSIILSIVHTWFVSYGLWHCK